MGTVYLDLNNSFDVVELTRMLYKLKLFIILTIIYYLGLGHS